MSAWLEILIIAAAVGGLVSAITGILQVLFQFWTLREIGEMDNDRNDPWERRRGFHWQDGEWIKNAPRITVTLLGQRMEGFPPPPVSS